MTQQMRGCGQRDRVATAGPQRKDERMSDVEMVLIKEVGDEAEAQVVMGLLRANGIEPQLMEDDGGDQFPSLEPVRGVKIFVPIDQAELAQSLLSAPNPPDDA